MSTSLIYTAKYAAELLECSIKTVEERLRNGDLPGLKFGDGWVIPAGAFWLRLDQLALEEAEKRRKPAAPVATTVEMGQQGKRSRGAARTLPQLVDMGAGS